MLSSKQLDRLSNQICWATGVCNWCMQQQNSNTPMMWDVGQKCPSVCPFACNTFTLQTVCLFCCFTSQVNSYGHGGTVSSPNHTFSWASFNKHLTSTSCTYFHLYLTTTLLEWFSRREENDRRNYFMINLHESTGPGWDSISRPLDSDSHLLPDTLPTAQTVILNPTEFVWWLTCTSVWAGTLLFFAFWIPFAWASESVHFLAKLQSLWIGG